MVTGDVPDPMTTLHAFAHAVAARPAAAALTYFDGELDLAVLEACARSVAGHLRAEGVQPGDRLLVVAHNSPTFAIGLLGTWYAGGCAVLVDPASGAKALARVRAHCASVGLLVEDDLVHLLDELALEHRQLVVCGSATDFQGRHDARVMHSIGVRTVAFTTIDDTVAAGREAPFPDVDSTGTALLAYPGAPTGQLRAASASHGELVALARAACDRVGLGSDDVMVAAAPLHTIAGTAEQFGAALLVGARLVLTNRFHPDVCQETVVRQRATVLVTDAAARSALGDGASARVDHHHRELALA